MKNIVLPTGNFLLPVCIDPDSVPDLLGAIDLYRVMRKKSETYPALDAILDGFDFVQNPMDSPCVSGLIGSGACWEIDTTNSAIKFHPNDPFVSIDKQNRPPIGQWERFEDSIIRPPAWMQTMINLADSLLDFKEKIRYYPNDCLVVPPDENLGDVTQFFSALDALVTLDFPYFEIEVSGVGELELHLLSVPYGGSAIIVWDRDFSIWDFLWNLTIGNPNDETNVIQTELEREILSFPPENNEENIIEIDFALDTLHNVRVYFVPRIDYTALDFLGNGGGLRNVSACGNLSIVSASGKLITKDNFKISEFDREGYIMATQDEIRTGVHLGIYDVMKHAIAGHGDGLNSNIKNDVKIDSTTGLISIVEQTTGGSVSGNKSKWSGMNYVYNGLLEYMQDFEDFSQEYPADLPQSQEFIAQKWDVGAGSDTAMADYYNHRVQLSLAQPADIPPALKGIMYCAGATKQAISAYIIDNITTDKLLILSMVSALEQAQIDSWYSIGSQYEREGYEVAPCYQIDDIVMEVTPTTYGTGYRPVTQVNGRVGKVWQVEFYCENPLLYSAGRDFDGAFLLDPNTGNWNLHIPTLIQSGGVSPVSCTTLPVYQDTYPKRYILEYVCEGTMSNWYYGNYNYAPTGGSVRMTFKDMGVV